MAVGRYGSAEAVVLPLNGVLAMFQQQQQERRAAQQLVDRQVNEDLSKLSFDGVRPQDTAAVRNAYDSFKEAAIQYKRALRERRGVNEAEAAYLSRKANRDMVIAASKGAKERDKGIIDFYGKNRDQIDPIEFAKTKSMIDAPVGTPEFEQSKNLDITNLVFKPERYDPKKIGDLISIIKPVETNVATPMANGQISYVNKKVLPPLAVSTIIGNAYDNDYENTKKYYDNKFQSLPEEDRDIYQAYAEQYLPGFQIDSPKELAIAENIYGRIDQGIETGVKGTDRGRIERFAREQQARQIAAADARQARQIAAMDRREKQDFYVEDSIAKSLNEKDYNKALLPFKSAASPGVNVAFIKYGKDATNNRRAAAVLADLKKNGIDAITRQINDEDVKQGVILVTVPRINPQTKATIPGEYDYMAVSAADKQPQTRINAVLGYAKGGAAKPLPNKYYQQAEQDVIYAPDMFSPTDEKK